MKISRFLICALAMAVLCLGGKARAAEEPAAISFGIISYAIINTLTGHAKRVSPLMYVLAVIFICKYILL